MSITKFSGTNKRRDLLMNPTYKLKDAERFKSLLAAGKSVSETAQDTGFTEYSVQRAMFHRIVGVISLQVVTLAGCCVSL